MIMMKKPAKFKSFVMICVLYCYFFKGFPFQRGRRHMSHIPSLGYSHCEVIRLRPYVFYPDKPLEVQITVNHIDTSDKSYVHDAAVSWVENVSYDRFTACVMAAGYNERKSKAYVTVDWMAYQGAPVGGVAGEVRLSQWWTGTTCKSVNFPSVGYFSCHFTTQVYQEEFRIACVQLSDLVQYDMISFGLNDLKCHLSLDLRTFAPIATAHRYCARKFTRHVMHRARALRNKLNNDKEDGWEDGHCYSFAWI